MTNPNQEKIRIIIAEDQGLIAYSLQSMLRTDPGFEVTGIASNGEELLKMLEHTKPDVILMDIVMPRMNGIEVTRILDERMPWIRIVCLSMHQHPAYIKEMMKSGVKGFLSKNCTIEELSEAIRLVHSGKPYFCPITSTIILNGFTNDPQAEQNGINQLTSREIEIIQMLSEGSTAREIADRLFISEKTVDRHKNNILKKLNVRNTAHLVRYAVESGILLK